MIKLEEINEKSYELQWLEAERELALLEYENYVWLHKEVNNDGTP